jgi:hypothetical protein
MHLPVIVAGEYRTVFFQQRFQGLIGGIGIGFNINHKGNRGIVTLKNLPVLRNLIGKGLQV